MKTTPNLLAMPIPRQMKTYRKFGSALQKIISRFAYVKHTYLSKSYVLLNVLVILRK